MDAHGDMYTPQFATHRNMQLKWDYKMNLVGRKDPDPKVHNCEKCNFPVKAYGRLIPCKHVFCFDCAKATDKSCLRCGDPVQRIEQSPQGSIFLCTYGAPKHSHTGCRRTYLSQRDLLSHVNHRHIKAPPQGPGSSGGNDQGHNVMPRMTDQRSDSRGDMRTHQSYAPPHQEGYPPPAPVQSSHVMPEQRPYEPRPSDGGSGQVPGPEDYRVKVPVRKSNLITVPLHDSSKDYQQQVKPHVGVPSYNPQVPPPPMVPVQQQHQGPPPPPPQQHVPYSQHHPPPPSVSHVPTISHPPPVSVTYSVPPISGHQVMHSMHPPPGPIYSQPAPRYDNAPRPPFLPSNPLPPPSVPFPAPEVSIPQPGWPVRPPPPTNMPPPPPQSNMPPPPQTSMPPPPPPSQVPPMVNAVPSMPPPQVPVPRTDMGPPPPPMIAPMTEASRYPTGQYYM